MKTRLLKLQNDYDRIMKGRIMKGRLMKGRIMKGRIMKGRIMKGRIMNGKKMTPLSIIFADHYFALIPSVDYFNKRSQP